jgi:hypothetical protein
VTTDLLVILVFGAGLAGWVLLALVGAERQRMMSEADASRARAQPEPPAPPGVAKAPLGRAVGKARKRPDVPTATRPAAKSAPSTAPNAR